MNQPQPIALYLRADGSLLLVRGEAAVEMPLTPAQLVQLGMDALRVAVNLDPRQVPAAMHALETTYVLPSEVPECVQPH